MGQPRMDNQETKATLDTRHRTKTNKEKNPQKTKRRVTQSLPQTGVEPKCSGIKDKKFLFLFYFICDGLVQRGDDTIGSVFS